MELSHDQVLVVAWVADNAKSRRCPGQLEAVAVAPHHKPDSFRVVHIGVNRRTVAIDRIKIQVGCAVIGDLCGVLIPGCGRVHIQGQIMIYELTKVGIPCVDSAESGSIVQKRRFDHCAPEFFHELAVFGREFDARFQRTGWKQVPVFVQSAVAPERRRKPEESALEAVGQALDLRNVKVVECF